MKTVTQPGWFTCGMRSSTGAEDTVVVTILSPTNTPIAQAILTPEEFGRAVAGNQIIECSVRVPG